MLLCVAPGLETVNCRCTPLHNTRHTPVFAAGLGVTAAVLLSASSSLLSELAGIYGDGQRVAGIRTACVAQAQEELLAID
jgi:hypothetical protein